MSEWDEWRVATAEQKAQAAEALAAAGFGPAFSADGLFGIKFTFCRTCGCAVPLTPIVDGQSHPLDLHVATHKKDAPPTPGGG